MNVPCPVCGGSGRRRYCGASEDNYSPRCDACYGTGYQDDGAGIVPELNASSRLAAAEAKILELEREVERLRLIADDRRDDLRRLLCEGHDAGDYVHTPDNFGCVICDAKYGRQNPDDDLDPDCRDGTCDCESKPRKP